MKSHQPQVAGTRPGPESQEQLSALVDGRADSLDVAAQLWRDDPEARANWHAYHLIGDVMRSEDLASPSARDADFMARLRGRLAQEPVVLSPVKLPALPMFSGWRLSAAWGFGGALVAGFLVFTRVGGDGAPAAALELAAAAAPQGSASGMPQLAVGQGLITDPRLDEFLRAHQAAGGLMSAAAPGGALRRVEAIVPVGALR
jgi:sigma-E factor negative regulatory protein RseA